jgi:RNA polymerase sigma-70 factor (sigma-E family)
VSLERDETLARPRPGPEESGARTFAELYEVLFEPMVRVAYLMVGERAVAEDVTQDAFAQLHRRWDAVDQPAAYVRASIVNGCRQHHRRRARERARFPELIRPELAPDTLVVLDAVARLPFRQRAALVMRFYEDRPDAEIAAALGCRPATVRSLVHRGLQSLRNVIDR